MVVVTTSYTKVALAILGYRTKKLFSIKYLLLAGTRLFLVLLIFKNATSTISWRYALVTFLIAVIKCVTQVT